ncbi:HSP20 family protein [Parapedobacter composti]|uniref:HSP20 family protein n=1 Tax=Parapedobacter composti TaxID=623281 RepID=A0A1I1GCP0_9SPHI|nr:Hsp20/alpha crystallin family protein [Parapedobacter composti]SFC09255.1 HSP20 family protein [Parapedobacter composti]
MTLVKFSNSNKNRGVDNWVNDFFSPVFNDSFFSDRFISRVPAVNVAETNDAYHIELAAPGLDKGDFKINVDGDVLTISGEKKVENAEENKKYSKREYSYTSFTRSFTLPDSIDHNQISANYKDGVLRVDIAKKEEAKIASRLIEVQ